MRTDKSRITTVNHNEIQNWAKGKNARPVKVKNFSAEDITGRIRFRFPKDEYPNEEDLSWDEFFDIFDSSRLEFVFEDIADEAIENGNIYQFQPRKY